MDFKGMEQIDFYLKKKNKQINNNKILLCLQDNCIPSTYFPTSL